LREYLAADHREQLKVVAAGVKIFERQEHKDPATGPPPCDYRLTQDGLHMMLPFVTKQIVHPTLEELKLILQRRSLNLASDPDRPERALFVDERTKAEVAAMRNGSCVFLPRIETDADRAMLQESASTPEEIAIACWKGKNSVNLLVSKAETDHLLEKFGVDVSSRGGGGAPKTAGMEVN
jgi:multisite-specific tRNA:(cytosine-C5)-methyltransferase